MTFFWKTSACTADYPCGPYADWPSLFSALYPSFALAGQDFNTIWTNCICGSDGKPVADGPFYLASYAPGEGSVLKANPYYHDRAKLAEVDIKIITDAALETEAIRDGQVDVIYPPLSRNSWRSVRSPGHVHGVTGYSLERFELREGSVRGGPTVTKGASNVLLRAPWMREAIALPLNRQGMIDAVYGPGSGLKPTNSLLYFPGQQGYRPDFARWNYAPAAALTILRKHCTGGPTTPDPSTTKVWHCSGLPALFRYLWPSAAPAARTTIEQLAKANLRAVGISIVDRPLPPEIVFSAEGIPSGDFDVAEYAEFTSGDPGDWNDLYRCFAASNFTGYCSHTVDALLNAANNQLNPTERAALFGRADALMAKQLPASPLFQKPLALVHKSALLGIGPNPGIFSVFWNIQDWHWKH